MNRSLGILCVAGLVAATTWWLIQVRDPLRLPAADAAPEPLSDEQTRRVTDFCGACHALPRPESFTREKWHHEVMRGYEFYAKSDRELDPPPPAEAIRYFQSRAPDKLPDPEVTAATAGPPARFHITTWRVEAGRWQAAPAGEASASASQQHAPGGGADLHWHDGKMLLTDMRLGACWSVSLSDAAGEQLGRLDNPCHIEPTDLDGDGRTDYVVADLGSFSADDHQRGRICWLTEGADGWQAHVLADGIGRAADVRPADIDGDGDLDLVAAEFGWMNTGGLHVLWNDDPPTSPGQPPQFTGQTLWQGAGASHLLIEDVDGDQHLDVVALISQEHERIDAFVASPERGWERRTLWQADDPAYGLSCLTAADLDGDGDRDLLVTNGDTMDSKSYKPSHGVQWLRRDGDQWTMQRLIDFPGAYAAVAADVDNDGDLDIVAAAWLPEDVPAPLPFADREAVVLLHNTPAGYERHVLRRGGPRFPCLEAGDFDNDGDVDFAAGRINDASDPSLLWLWTNRLH